VVISACCSSSSCTGNGFLGSTNCSGYGNACTACTGVRDTDWAKHARNTPSTVDNFTRTTCPAPSANNPNYVGPCGADAIARGGALATRREGHCESLVASEAAWDLANRDLPSPGSGSAWATLDRLWFLSRSRRRPQLPQHLRRHPHRAAGPRAAARSRRLFASSAPSTTTTVTSPAARPAAPSRGVEPLRHHHDAGWNTTFRAAQPATPGSRSPKAQLSGPRPAARRASTTYRKGPAAAPASKGCQRRGAASFRDTAVANGVTYYYQVTARPSGNGRGFPGLDLHLGDPGRRSRAAGGARASARRPRRRRQRRWSASLGATSYVILRSTTSGACLGRHLLHTTSFPTAASRSTATTRRAGEQRHLLLGQLGAGSALHLGLHRQRADQGVPVTGISRRHRPSVLDPDGARRAPT
jgi:hypothetical protein